ncbi:hypothetical protein V6N11_039175 [Hibiscus sabdariffa]|uniref:Uncharacterized protein n=1 Tax=Hibiscus sabdariffa TaxID=183260 RepID=A0ABR2SMX8_9ROSI
MPGESWNHCRLGNSEFSIGIIRQIKDHWLCIHDVGTMHGESWMLSASVNLFANNTTLQQVVVKWLGLEKHVFTCRSTIRGHTRFEGGHNFGPKFRQFVGKGVRSGFLPSNDENVYWFLTWTPSTKEEELEDDPVKLKQFVLNKLGDTPVHMKSVQRQCLCIRRHPSSHDSGPRTRCVFSLGRRLRCLAEALSKPGGEEINEGEEYKRIEMGLRNFAEKRRWRSFDLITTDTTYVVGFIQQNSGMIMNCLHKR